MTKRLCSTVLMYKGIQYNIQKPIEWRWAVPYVECSYLQQFLPVSEFRRRPARDGEGWYLEQPSRRGAREKSWADGEASKRKEKNVEINGVLHRMCGELGELLPIDHFPVIERDGKRSYSPVSREGKIVENRRNLKSTRRAIREWKRRNRHKVNASYKKRVTTQKRACPKWLTEEQHRAIESVYHESQMRTTESGTLHHVHHVYPLYGTNERGEHVSCGLHVPWNLAAIPATTNLRIGRRNPEFHTL